MDWHPNELQPMHKADKAMNVAKEQRAHIRDVLERLRIVSQATEHG